MELSHRKAAARVRFVTYDGTPLANRPVQLNQVSHSFLFGCGVFDSVQLFREENPDKQAVIRARLEKWLKLFNYGTLPFYWGRYEPEEGKTARKETLQAAEYLRTRGVTLKGHPLCWHTACAPWLLKYSNEEIMRRQLGRITRDVTDFIGLIDLWDVINEVVIMPEFDRYDNAVTRLCQEKGRVVLVKAVFERAQAANPKATLLINDFNTSPRYEQLIEDLLEAGVSISAIGIQSHQHQGYWGAEKLHDVLHRFSRFGLPIHFTENTLISGHLMPPHIVDLNDYQVEDWPSTPEGEERQVREVSEMYSILFAHPLVEAITTWDFTDRCWLNAPAGFLRADDSGKPSYDALFQLIHGAWETHDQLQTDADGCAALCGFKGDYLLTVDGKELPFSLKENADAVLTIRLPE